YLAAIQRADEQVAVVSVGAEQVAELQVRRAPAFEVPVDVVRRAQSEVGCEETGQRDDAKDDQAGDGRLVAQEPVPRIRPQAATLDFLNRTGRDVCDCHGLPQSYRTLGSRTP